MDKVNKLVYFSLLLLFFSIPILFYPGIYHAFVLPKSILLQIITILLVFIWLIKIIKDNKFTIRLYNLSLPIVLFLFIFSLSYLLSYHRLSSKQEFYLNLCMIFQYFIITNFITDTIRLKNLFVAFFLSGVFVAIYSILQHFGIDFVQWEGIDTKIRSTSTLGNPDFLSAYLSLIIPINLLLLIISERKYKIFLLGSLFVIFLGMMFTYSRGGWLTSAVGIIVLLLLVKRRLSIVNIFYISIFLIFIITVIFIMTKKEKVVIDKIETDVFSRIKSTMDLEYPSIRIRKYIFHDSLHMIKSRMIYGWGLDTFPVVFPKFRSKELLSLAGRYNLPEAAHNEYLQIAASCGVIGLFILLWIIILTLYNYLRNYNNELNIGFFACFIVFLLQSLFYYKLIPTYLLFFFTISGISIINSDCMIKEYKFRMFKITKILIYITSISIILLVSISSGLKLLADYYYKEGRDYAVSKIFGVAEKNFIKAYQLVPQDKTYIYSLPLLYEYIYKLLPDTKNIKKEKKRLLQKGIERYNIALKLYPYDAFLYGSCAKLYTMYALDFDLSKLKLAYKYYNKAIELDKNNCIFYNDLGLVYLYDKKENEAIKNFKKAISLDETYALPYSNLGLIYYNKKNIKLAIKYLKKATDLDPEFKEAFLKLAIIYKSQGDNKTARYYLSKAKEIDKEDKLIDRLLKEW